VIEKIPLPSYGKLELNSCLKKLVIIFAQCWLPESQPFGILRDIHSVIITKRRSKSITTIDAFQMTCTGYLQLTSAKWQSNDHDCFKQITWEGQRYASWRVIMSRLLLARFCVIMRLSSLVFLWTPHGESFNFMWHRFWLQQWRTFGFQLP
jgi:hypothetical protein